MTATTTGLSKNKTKVLQALSETKDGLTRSQMSELLNIHKGWAKLLGAYTKGAGGMEAEGLVASRKIDGVKGIVYVITDQGRKALKGETQTSSEEKSVETTVAKTKGKGKGEAKPEEKPAKSEAEIRAEEKADAMIAAANAKAKAKREKAKSKSKTKKTEATTEPVTEPVVESTSAV